LPIELAKGLVVSELQKDRVSATPAPRPSLKLPLPKQPPTLVLLLRTLAQRAKPSSKGEPAKEKSAEPKLAPANFG